MSGRNEEQQDVTGDVESNDQESISDLAPTSEVSINIARFPSPRHSRRNSDFWTLLLTGSTVAVGGVAAGVYAVRNFQNTTGWAVIFSSATLGGVYLVARSLRQVRFNNLFNNPFNPQTRESRDFEGLSYREILQRNLGPTVDLPPSWTPSDTGSFPPSPAVSNVSSDLLTVERTDYRPHSTDMSFRQKQEDRAKKYKKFVGKEWMSAPSMLMRQRSKASKDDEDKKEDSASSMLQRQRSNAGKDDEDKKEDSASSKLMRQRSKASKDDEDKKEGSASSMLQRPNASKDDEDKKEDSASSKLMRNRFKASKDDENKKEDSASSKLMRQRSNASKDEKEDEKDQVENEEDERFKIEEERERKV